MSEPLMSRLTTMMQSIPPDAVSETGGDDLAPFTAGPKKTVLCVDDEVGILSALKRALRSPDVTVITATSGEQALELMAELPIDLIISDMRMPGMDGAQLLERSCRDWPDTVRILLTGYSDTAATIQAVNRGQIFRYLQKPWDDRELVQSVREGLELRLRMKHGASLVTMSATQGERLRQLSDELQQLQQQHATDRRETDSARQRHYFQCVKVLTNLLELRCTDLFEHGRRVAALSRDIARRMELSSEAVLEVFVAGLLHDVGLMGLSVELLSQLDGKAILEDDGLYRDHPAHSARALSAMDEMLPVASMIEAHHEQFDGKGFPGGKAGADIPIGARILAFADALDHLAHGRSDVTGCDDKALSECLIAERGTRFDPAVVDAWVGLSRSKGS